ncbi:transcription factor bHLH121 [Primulina eburnea]|uniref:transcription factor bHLH121 n=1 Tax=Primulina eburnea TaxID=1245227 RepID=UPI003C6C2193
MRSRIGKALVSEIGNPTRSALSVFYEFPHSRFHPTSYSQFSLPMMDQLQSDSNFPPLLDANNFQPSPDVLVPSTRPHADCRMEAETKDSTNARKVQKADREKLRRDRLNEQFTELGNTLDPDRPKNDKASILTDTIQILKDLASQVDRLKAEYAALTEESRELTQEKNDLREEKTSLKSDIDGLNSQYQQRMRVMYPWAGMDHSVVMHPPSYPFPMPVPIPTGPIPLHPSLQPYPFYGNQNPTVPNPCSTYVPYMAHNSMLEQQSTILASQVMQQGSVSHNSSKQDPRNKSPDGESRIEKSDDSNDIATNLELKTPGSASEQDSSSKQRKTKKILRKETSLTDVSSSSGCSSTHSVQPSSCDSIAGGKKVDS